MPRALTALIHVHTTDSDGTADLPAIVDQARRAGVEVVILTDHNLVSRGGGWHDGVLVIAGEEVTRSFGHLLALGHTRPLAGRRPPDLATAIAQAQAAGALSFLAHPLDGPPGVRPGMAGYSAADFTALDCTGVELWNVLTAMKRNLLRPAQAFLRLIMPLSSLPGPEPSLLSLWDTLGRRRRWVGIGGADAHGMPFGKRWLRLRLYSYRRHMGLVTTGIWLDRELSGEAAADAELVLAALGLGRCYAALGPARGFACSLDDGRVAHLPGSELAFSPGLVLEARLPAAGELRLLCSGREVTRSRGRRLAWRPDRPGVWRVESRRRRLIGGWRPWIFCNPFYLREAA